MKTASPTYLWWNELLAQIIEGAADSFKVVVGGSFATQMTNVTSVQLSGKQVLVSMAVGAGLYAAAYLKAHPLPTVSVVAEPQINPPPAPPPPNPTAQ